MSTSSIAPGEEHTIVGVKTPTSPIPNFAALGDKGMTYHRETQARIYGFDPVPIFKLLSKNATWLWWELVDIRNIDTNVAILRGKTQSQYIKSKISKAYKELARYSLVHRFKREHYLINPSAMLPNFKNYVSVAERWRSYSAIKLYPKYLALNSTISAGLSPHLLIKPRRFK